MEIFNKSRSLTVSLFCLTLLSVAAPCFGTTIVANGPSFGGEQFATLNNPINGLNGYGVEWSQTGSYTNVSVAANVISQFGPTTVNAWITDGTGTILQSDLGDVIAQGNNFADKTFFNGISLGAGTYYFIIALPGTTNPNVAGWGSQTGTGATTDTGVTYLNSVQAFGASLTNPLGPFPSGNFSDGAFVFSVTTAGGTETPEPATWLSLVGGLALLGVRKLCR